MPVYDEEYWREQDEYNRRCELEYERQQAEYYYEQYLLQEELAREKRRYPLFFLKDGIV